MKATTTSVGMVQLSTSASATDPNAGALSVTEKNASMSGSLANQIANIVNQINNMPKVNTHMSFHTWVGNPNSDIVSISHPDITFVIAVNGDHYAWNDGYIYGTSCRNGILTIRLSRVVTHMIRINYLAI